MEAGVSQRAGGLSKAASGSEHVGGTFGRAAGIDHQECLGFGKTKDPQRLNASIADDEPHLVRQMPQLKSIIYRYRPPWAVLLMVTTLFLAITAGVPMAAAIATSLVAGLVATLLLKALRPKGPGRWTE